MTPHDHDAATLAHPSERMPTSVRPPSKPSVPPADLAEMLRDEGYEIVGEAEDLDDPRMAACVAGTNLALEQLFNQDDLSWVDSCMPADLLPPYAALLRLKRPRSAEDFAEALLASKQRLGRFLRG